MKYQFQINCIQNTYDMEKREKDGPLYRIFKGFKSFIRPIVYNGSSETEQVNVQHKLYKPFYSKSDPKVIEIVPET